MVRFKESLLTPNNLAIDMEYATEEEQSKDIDESFASIDATKTF